MASEEEGGWTGDGDAAAVDAVVPGQLAFSGTSEQASSGIEDAQTSAASKMPCQTRVQHLEEKVCMFEMVGSGRRRRVSWRWA